MSHPIDQPQFDSGLARHVREIQESERASFHMPGHKGGRGAPLLGRSLLGDAVYAADLSELGGFDYLHGATSALVDAQQRAAALFGAERTWFLVNGATVGNIAAIGAIVTEGQKILVARASHRSVYAGIAISGANPVYLPPVRNNELDGLFGVDLQEIVHALVEHPDIKAVHITTPSFYGFTTPLRQISDLVHQYNIPLIVDEAHGTHFQFNDSFPESALSCGADLVVQSPHKTLGSLTQSSLLHSQGSRVPTARVQALLEMLQSSSPSALLLVSLDATINEMATIGTQRWQHAIDLAHDVRRSVGRIKDLRVYQDEIKSTRGICDYDVTKIVVDVDDLGTTGYAAGRWLRSTWQINPEFSDLRRMVFSITTGDDKEQADLLVEALSALAGNKHDFKQHPNVVSLWPSEMPRERLSPRVAQQLPDVSVDLSAAIGRIAAEMIIPYPPGVPLVITGEEISGELLLSMEQLIAAGCHIVGLADPTGKTLRVVV